MSKLFLWVGGQTVFVISVSKFVMRTRSSEGISTGLLCRRKSPRLAGDQHIHLSCLYMNAAWSLFHYITHLENVGNSNYRDTFILKSSFEP